MDQVFVDPSGRRRRIARTVGIVTGCLLAAYMVVVATGLFTGSGTPFTPWPGTSHKPWDASPTHGGAPPVHSPSHRPSSRPTTSPRPRTTHATTPSPRPSVTGRDHGRGHGLTRSPNPRKPTG